MGEKTLRSVGSSNLQKSSTQNRIMNSNDPIKTQLLYLKLIVL